jgi:hypothetical protein
MNARFQQFLNANADHNFPLVETLEFSQGIPRNTGLCLMLLWPAFAAFPASHRFATTG